MRCARLYSGKGEKTIMKFVPYEKRSKKEKRIEDRSRRGVWEGLSPVTRVKASVRKYDRNKRKESDRKEKGE